MIVALIELLILLFKILVLSAIYSSIITIIISIISNKSSNTFLKKISGNTRDLWLFSLVVLVVICFQYRFSYSRDTGLGENSILPIGYGQRIENADGETTYFYPDAHKTEPNKDEIYIDNFSISNGNLCAKVANTLSDTPPFQYFVYQLADKTLKTFANENEYTLYAQENKLPAITQFFGFGEHYYEFIENRAAWKKWLLP